MGKAEPAASGSLSGSDLRSAFVAATAWLERHVSEINAINVFPVPDGDTGTNMFLTMRSTMEEAERLPASATVSGVLAAMAHGALMGARGNSGVILSQVLRGFAAACEGLEHLDGATVACGLSAGSDAAYKAVTQPVEGTILSVVRAAAEAAVEMESVGDVGAVLASAADAAQAAVQRTPRQLPALAEAGVVDAGGQGLFVLLQGLAAHARGEELAPAAQRSPVEEDWLKVTRELHGRESSLYGYCTEFLVGGERLDLAATRERMQQLGDSVLVVGAERLLRVHVHTDDPDAALAYGSGIGSLTQVKVDNIRQQAERFLEQHEALAPAPTEVHPIGLVAVASGPGLRDVLLSLGVSVVVEGGPTMNPSAGEIARAAESCASPTVIVLPNDKNVVLAAEQALGLTGKPLQVLPSRSLPQGVAAALALNQERSLGANLDAMAEAVAGVRTIEVTRAVRATRIAGVEVPEGRAIAVVDDELALAADSPEEALLGALASLSPDGGLITVYYGAGTAAASAEKLAGDLRARHPGCEVEVVAGGQPHYHYIASLE